MLSTWSERLKSLSWLRVCLSFVFAILFSLLTLGLLSIVRTPQTFAVIKARSEIMEFKVFNPDLSIIYGGGLRISSWPDSAAQLDKACVKGAIIPAVMSSITYQRIDGGELVIIVNGKGDLRRDDGKVIPFDGELVLFNDLSNPADTKLEACGNLTSNKFPIWGPGRIGAGLSMRSDGPGPILLEGELATFGRTIDLGPLKGGAMYAAGEPIGLPSGGYVDSNGFEGDDDKHVPAEQTALFGYVSHSADEPGLGVNVTTETPRLQLSTPGVRQDSNRIEIGLFAQVLNDPSILAIQLFAVLFALFWPISIDLIGLAVSKDGDQEKSVATMPHQSDAISEANPHVAKEHV